MRKSARVALTMFVLLTMLAGRLSLFVLPAKLSQPAAVIVATATKPVVAQPPIFTAAPVQTTVAYSVSTWIQSETTTTGRIIWKAEHGPQTISGYDLTLAEGTLAFEVGDGETSVAAETQLENPSSRHFIVGTFVQPADSTQVTIKLYVDGREVAHNENNFALPQFTENLFVGSEFGATKIFKGTIDQVSIVHTELQPEEIVRLFLQK